VSLIVGCPTLEHSLFYWPLLKAWANRKLTIWMSSAQGSAMAPFEKMCVGTAAISFLMLIGGTVMLFTF